MNALRKSKTKTKTLLFFIVMCLTLNLSAQLRANFSASPVSGCAPIVVQFTDQSSGNPTQWRWDLGNGTISSLQNPSGTYFNPGTYTVKLVVRNAAGNADSLIRTQYVTVYASPSVNFTANDSLGCAPQNVQFSNTSVAGSGNISSYQWDFGDGTSSSLQNPAHNYTTPGTYTVTLQVTNSFGCVKTFTKSQYIRVGSGTQAGFNYTVTSLCAAPVTVNFTNTSAGTGAMSYQWNFGDGTTSNSLNPVHTYAANGSYTVTLIAISSQGCIDTLVRSNLISIGNVSSNFNSPDSVCQGQLFSITNTSSPLPAFALWNFGDGTTATAINPVKSYALPGTYTIKLLNSFGGCMDSVSKTIVVKAKAMAQFTTSDSMFCSVPATVNFFNTSTNAISYQWNFGDGTTSTQVSPSHIYTAEGDYSVTLIALNANGCFDTLVKINHIKIHKPQITVSGFPLNGCIPYSVNPTASVTANEPIASYQWIFGDGGTGVGYNPIHTYTTAGTYTVKVIVLTVSGCTDTLTIPNAVKVGNKPTPNFSVNPTDICASSPVNFTDLTTGNVDQWLWQFGDGGISTSSNPVYQYSDTGWFNVQLIVWSNGCSDSIKLNDIVHIMPPIASFGINRSCVNRLSIDFIDHSIGAVTYAWDFGDGATSNIPSPSHTYNSVDAYTVTLTVTNRTCSYTTQQVIRIIQPTLTISGDSAVCKATVAHFAGTASNAVQWQWNFGDGGSAITPGNATHSYTNSGNYTVTASIVDSFGCTLTLTMPVHVFGPTASFSPTQASACLNGNHIQFNDASSTDGTHTIVQWTWNYGDGTIDSVATVPFIHVYGATGSYPVSLKVKDSYGCTDQISLPTNVVISHPNVSFQSPDTVSCTGRTIQFTNTSSGNSLTYQWYFGDATTSTAVHPSHTYATAGLFSITLVATDQYGCKDSLTRPAYINISIPKALFSVSDSIGTCPPLNVLFTDHSTNNTTIRWDFGDGNTSSIANPSHFYTTPGVYHAKLIVTGPGGCSDTMTKTITLRGPQGTFSYAPLSGCNPLTVSFTAHTQDNTSFVWDYSDGNTHSGVDSVITHTYTAIGSFLPKMILIDAHGCTVPIVGTDTVIVKGAAAQFTMNQIQLCDSGYINFTNTTISNDPAVHYLWNFGDGTTSTAQNPSHQYLAPGNYVVQLTATTQAGCVHSATASDTIKVYQGLRIHTLGDTANCIPATIQSLGVVDRGAATSWQWNFGNGQTSTQQNPTQVYTTAGAYDIVVVATDVHGCRDSSRRTVHARPLPTTNAGADLFVCQGSPITLNATGAFRYVWNASPFLSCLNCANPVATPPDTALFIVTGINAYGCSVKDTVQVNVKHPFTLLVNDGDTICVGRAIHLRASGADTYTWIPSINVDDPNAANTNARPTVTTLYKVVAKDNDHCFTDTGYVPIQVWQLPTVIAGVDQTITVGSSVQLTATASADVVRYQWTPTNSLSCATCQNPTAHPRQDTKYTVVVTNGGGCTAQSDVTVFVTCGKGNLFVPNTFSPNGDGNNDVFFPRGSGIGKVKSLRIFNRWGEVVFERFDFAANDIAAGWDGRYKGQPLSSDVYIYTCDVICENNELLTFKGDVTLLK